MKDRQRQERIFGIVGMLTICLPKSGQQLQTAAAAFCASVPSLIVLALPLLPFIYFMIMSRPPLYALCFVYLPACLPPTPPITVNFIRPGELSGPWRNGPLSHRGQGLSILLCWQSGATTLLIFLSVLSSPRPGN